MINTKVQDELKAQLEASKEEIEKLKEKIELEHSDKMRTREDALKERNDLQLAMQQQKNINKSSLNAKWRSNASN